MVERDTILVDFVLRYRRIGKKLSNKTDSTMLMSKSVRWKTIWSHYRKLKKIYIKTDSSEYKDDESSVL